MCVYSKSENHWFYKPPTYSFDSDPKIILTRRNVKAQTWAQNTTCICMGWENKLVASIMQKPKWFLFYLFQTFKFSPEDIFSLLFERKKHWCMRDTLISYLPYVPGLRTEPTTQVCALRIEPTTFLLVKGWRCYQLSDNGHSPKCFYLTYIL